MSWAPVAKATRHKVKRFTRRQLSTARLREERALRAEAKAEKKSGRRDDKRLARIEAAFEGVDLP